MAMISPSPGTLMGPTVSPSPRAAAPYSTRRTAPVSVISMPAIPAGSSSPLRILTKLPDPTGHSLGDLWSTTCTVSVAVESSSKNAAGYDECRREHRPHPMFRSQAWRISSLFQDDGSVADSCARDHEEQSVERPIPLWMMREASNHSDEFYHTMWNLLCLRNTQWRSPSVSRYASSS